MSRAHPVLGYPSKTAAVASLLKKGFTIEAIASSLGIEEKNVVALDISGRRKKRPAEANGRTVVFPLDILDRLRPHAEKRGVSANELVRRIVETTLDESMIDAVLDDGDVSHG